VVRSSEVAEWLGLPQDLLPELAVLQVRHAMPYPAFAVHTLPRRITDLTLTHCV
jgi:hypothetical protein